MRVCRPYDFLGVEPNPIPVKASWRCRHRHRPGLRLPLTAAVAPMPNRARIHAAFRDHRNILPRCARGLTLQEIPMRSKLLKPSFP